MRRQPRIPRRIWLTRLVAVIVALLVLQPSYGVSLACLGSSLAIDVVGDEPATPSEGSADGCCPNAPREEPAGEQHENCPCPFPCAAGCGGAPRAIVAGPALPEILGAPGALLPIAHQQRTPPNPEPLGIMHVPRPA